MTEIISITDIVQDPPKDYFMPSIGERTMAFINSQEKIDEDNPKHTNQLLKRLISIYFKACPKEQALDKLISN